LRGGIWVVAGKVVTAGSTVLISALLTRLLTQEDVGVFFIADKLIWFTAMLGLLGLNAAVVRLVAESLGTDRPGRARAAIGHVYRFAFGGVAVCAGFLAFGGGTWLALRVWQSPLLASLVGLVAVWGMLHSLQILTSETFRGFQFLGLATVFGGVVTGGLSVIVLWAMWAAAWPVTLRQVLLVIVGAAALSLAIALGWLAWHVRRLGPATPLPASEVLRIGVPLWINGLMAYAMTQSDVLVLGMFRPAEEVAIYGASARLVSLVLMSLMLVNLVVPPFIAELYARQERARLERMLRLTATMAGLPAVAVLLVYLAVGAPLLGLVYGEAYRQGAAVLALLSIGRLIHVATGSASITLSMTGHHDALMRITVVASVATIVGTVLAVRPFGGVGVAAVVCAGVIVHSLWIWLTARRATGIWTHVAMPRLREIRELMKL